MSKVKQDTALNKDPMTREVSGQDRKKKRGQVGWLEGSIRFVRVTSPGGGITKGKKKMGGRVVGRCQGLELTLKGDSYGFERLRQREKKRKRRSRNGVYRRQITGPDEGRLRNHGMFSRHSHPHKREVNEQNVGTERQRENPEYSSSG